MDKNYYMVQIVWPPGLLPNAELEELTLSKYDEYIKAGKATMNGVFWQFNNEHLPWDYRRSGCPLMAANGFSPKPNEEFTVYRVFIDQNAAIEYIQFMLGVGVVSARIVTEDDKLTGQVGMEFPFPSESRVGQRIWPGHPDFVYEGTYPAPGPADAIPIRPIGFLEVTS